ncbi:hypothetical protein PYW08_010288 [Mythimna loreyi]|uniref:Uncharacterized protein n=1 Tax=Mythimna loreyi TaxID=667449 RepID=A0ACC2Q4N0_9NEOP|nr:hypothetical protein PYW08_010288 [Mythimna loreyi]
MVFNVTCQSIIYCVYFNIFCRRYLKFRYAIMILRLVYSFFFFSLVTGNQRLEDLTRAARTGDCQNKICVCQDQQDSNAGLPQASPIQSSSHRHVVAQFTETPPQVAEDRYGYPAQGMINASPVVHSTKTRIEKVERQLVPDDSLQIQRPVQYEEEKKEYGEKTICFTPSMVHKMIKAALEYVSQMPSDLNNIISKLDQESDRMSDQGYENAVKKPLYPLDSKTIFQMLDKPKSETRTNLILKYQLPSHKEPYCRDALEKLIELAYTAYMDLEQHPQCREYLYNFAGHQPEDRPKGHLDRPPIDMKSLIASILHQVDKRKPILDMAPEKDRYGDMELPEHGLPKPLLYNVPKIHEFNIPKKPQIVEYNAPDVSEFNIPKVKEYKINEYNVPGAHELYKPALNLPKNHAVTEKYDFIVPKVHDFTVTESHEYNVPKVQQYSITESHEYNVPKVQEYTITQNHEYNIPKVQEYSMTENREYNVPKVQEYPKMQEYTITENREYNVPKVQEYTITQNHEYNVPKVQEYTVTENREYNVPHVQGYTITQNHEFNVPKVHEYTITQSHEYNIPQIHKTIHETVEEVIPMQPEETITILIELLKNIDQPGSGNLLDRLMNIVQENQNNFHPRILKLLFALLNAQKQNNIYRFKDIIKSILDSQRNDWPLNDRLSDALLSYLTPDHTGNLDSRIIEIILELYKKPVRNDKYVEHILSLLRPVKEGNLETRIRDLILKLIHLYQHDLLHPNHVDTLLKLLKPSLTGNGHPIEADVTDLLTRWNDMGINPNQLDRLFAFLKPYANGHPDRRPIDIIHFLLTNGKTLGFHLDFILSFLLPENGVLDTRRIEVIHFLLKNISRYPKLTHILLTLLEKDAPGVLNSRFLDILLFLDNQRLLTPELVETLLDLLANDVTGQVDDNKVKTLFFQLAPFKHSNPKLILEVSNILNRDGMYNNIAEWVESIMNDIGVPNRDSNPSKLKVTEEIIQDNSNEYRNPTGGYQAQNGGQQMPDHDFMSIFKWLDSQGLITPDQGSNTDLVHKIMKILEVGERELGVVELTYMLKHEKPLIYQPVYYVKYRLPILSFISNMKNLLLENPHLNSDPMKLLQELIVVSNVTEVSPNLQGYPKEEILKLTFNDGDLVQAKILDEQNLSLNDQISYVHGLNSDISPEEILQLNRMNEAKYFPNLKEVKGVHPDQLTVKDVDKFIDVPTVHYKHVEMNPTLVGNTYKTKTVKTIITRVNQNQNTHNNNAQFMPQN